MPGRPRREARPPTRGTNTRFERVRRGVYVAEVDWPTTEREARHFVRMQALAESMRHDPVFSHQSAAVLWGIPVIGRFTSVHVIAAGRVGVRSQRGISWHNDRISDDDVTTVDGYQVTTYARTLFDLARASDFAAAVAALDFGLRSVTVTPLGDGAARRHKGGVARASGCRGRTPWHPVGEVRYRLRRCPQRKPG